MRIKGTIFIVIFRILYIQLTDLSDVKTKEKVDVSAIQLLGILLSNKIDPFVVGSIPGVTREM